MDGTWPSHEEAIQTAFKYRERGLPAPYWNDLAGPNGRIFVASYARLLDRRIIDVICTDWDDITTYTTAEPFMTTAGWEEVEAFAKRHPLGYEIGDRKVRGYTQRMRHRCGICKCGHTNPVWTVSITDPGEE